MMAALLSMTLGFAAQADDTKADGVLKDAKVLWESRDNASKLDDLIALLDRSEAEIASGTANVQAQIRVIYARALQRKGVVYTSDKNAKLAIFEKSMDQAKKSAAAVDSADAKYFYAAGLARWAETKGIMSSLGKKDELIANLTDAKSRKTLADASGEALEGWGPDRVLGKIYAKLPAFAGGNRVKSLELLNKAYAQAPKFALNSVFLAEVLGGGDAKEKAKACDVLSKLLAQDANTLMPERVIETKEEFKDAQELQGQLCK